MSRRTTTASAVVCTVLSLSAGACASSDGGQRAMGFDAAGAAATVATPAAPAGPARAPALNVIMKLRFRDMDLTVASGPDSPRFAVTARGGTPLAASLDERQLAEEYPDLHELYRSAVAQTGRYLDARLDHDFHGQAADPP